MPPRLTSVMFRTFAITLVGQLLWSATPFVAASPCATNFWWSPELDTCIECTRCDAANIVVLRPCQPHQNTVCGDLSELEMDWGWLSPADDSSNAVASDASNSNWKERRKETSSSSSSSSDERSADELLSHWQTASLCLAAIACLLFFMAAAILLIQNSRQWRRLEKRFDADVEELSAQLMARIAGVQAMDSHGRCTSPGRGASGHGAGGMDEMTANGGDTNCRGEKAHRQQRRIQMRCVYLEQFLRKDLAKAQVAGNVYIEEKSPKTINDNMKY